MTEHASLPPYVHWFRQSSPYINAHRDKTFVIMLEGEALDDAHFTHLVHDLALLQSFGVRLVLVHGARPQIDRVLTHLNLQSRFEQGVRITDDPALAAVKAAVGIVKADIESRLSLGLPDSPMHGARIRVVSGNFVMAKPRGVIDGIDYQHTGEVRRIEHQAIRELLQQRHIVLLSPTGYSPAGDVFNLTAEDVALHTATALRADKLILLSAEQGLNGSNGELLREITCRQLEQCLPALDEHCQQLSRTAIRAVRQGVPRAHIISHSVDGALLQELFTREGGGTMISREPYDQLRPARTDDVAGILNLLQPLEQDGTLVKRSRELLENELQRFFVIERDGLITACAALHPYSDDDAELACVAVHPDYRGGQRGQRLLQQVADEARRRGFQRLFVLTTRTAHWFIEQGFVAGDVGALPAARQQLYNFQRNSKVFFYAL
ncbi:amino-acid N-acetyltransferase [Bacterioplanes sanyensis]|uniref:amino-acid N-acetyltransferase n=1 Tax=Bacterioplanes sanyensis TaxID=1249553 RepID=UPI001E5E69A7|nr:amino-acid N-acetyltransferase [Bacterioplanes sanyensis]